MTVVGHRTSAIYHIENVKTIKIYQMLSMLAIGESSGNEVDHVPEDHAKEDIIAGFPPQ